MAQFPTIQDPASAANFDECIVTHMDFHWRVLFGSCTVKGATELTVTRKAAAVKLVLDAHQLTVDKVQVNGEDADFYMREFTFFGSALSVALPHFSGDGPTEQLQVKIWHHSGQGAAGLCWLTPEQTAGKTMPYLFTQGQAVLNRSVFPCMDSPAVRSSFSAVVEVPEGFTAVMSAAMLSPAGGEPVAAAEEAEEGEAEAEEEDEPVVWKAFRFELPQTVPSYLVALAVGDLVSREIGPRSRVWCEPCQADAAQFEFSEITEQYVATGERLFGPYLWDTYDIVVMPPAFPYGGMENPRLTFVTPCLICGDRSLGDVVAHEIAHSWFGNLVTNETWSDFFLNEGFTMFAQRKITEEVHGLPFTMLEATTGRALLEQCVADFGPDNPMTRLRIPLEDGIDPDDSYSEVAYEKGYALLKYLESVVGAEPFLRWMREYAQAFQFRSIGAETMFEHFLDFFPEQREAGLAEREGFAFVADWLLGEGMGPYCPDYSAGAELTGPAEAAAAPWAQGCADAPDLAVAVHEWPLYQQLHFLDEVFKGELKGGADGLATLADAYGFDNSTNAEVKLRWCQLVAKHGATAFFDNVRRFLAEQGKQKYTLPIYKELVKREATRELATEIFDQTKNQLHVSVAGYVRRVLSGSSSE